MNRRKGLVILVAIATFFFIQGRNRGLWFRSVGTYEVKITLYSEAPSEPEPVAGQAISCYYNPNAIDAYHGLGDIPGSPLTCSQSALITDDLGEIIFRAK